MKVYTDSFYEFYKEDGQNSAKEIVSLVLGLIQPESVIDIGCGTGTWLSIFKENGVKDIFGVDGEWVNRKMLKIPEELFLAWDLKKSLPINRQFDLIVSLEVAEHLPPECAEIFVESLTKLGPVVLFAAAIPFQGGTGHINEQWPDYWGNYFHKKGYKVIDCIRKKIWQDNIQIWYTQNILMYVREDYLDSNLLLKKEFQNTNISQLSIVHPKMYLQLSDPKNMSKKKIISSSLVILKNAMNIKKMKTYLNKRLLHKQYFPENFYRDKNNSVSKAAKQIIPLVLELVYPESVIDIGCGTGAWLSAFSEYGLNEIWGIDGEWINKNKLKIPKERFLAYDITKPIRIDRQFDLVISLEVAEHLPPKKAEIFIDSLTRLGPVILFSAAIPFQSGDKHLNEQWPEYWVKLFKKKGYEVIDCIRKRIWQNDINVWYAQNTFIYARMDYIDSHPLLKKEFEDTNVSQLSIVHPKLHLQLSDPNNMSLRMSLLALQNIFKISI